MSTFNAARTQEVTKLQEATRQTLAHCESLEEAAQASVSLLYETYPVVTGAGPAVRDHSVRSFAGRQPQVRASARREQGRGGQPSRRDFKAATTALVLKHRFCVAA